MSGCRSDPAAMAVISSLTANSWNTGSRCSLKILLTRARPACPRRGRAGWLRATAVRRRLRGRRRPCVRRSRRRFASIASHTSRDAKPLILINPSALVRDLSRERGVTRHVHDSRKMTAHVRHRPARTRHARDHPAHAQPPRQAQRDERRARRSTLRALRRDRGRPRVPRRDPHRCRPRLLRRPRPHRLRRPRRVRRDGVAPPSASRCSNTSPGWSRGCARCASR